MIEFLAGILVGVIALGTGVWVSDSPSVDELTAENAEFRTALRHIRGITMRYPDLLSIANYVDAVLGDEAGA